MSTPTPSPTPARKRKSGCLDWKSIVGLLISAALLWWLFKDLDPRQVFGLIRQADPLYFGLAIFCVTAVFWLRAFRWKAILDPVNPNTTFRSRFAATTIGFMGNNLLPARIGEFMRAYALSRVEKVPVVSAFTSLVIERLFDGLFIVSFLFISIGMPGFPGFGGTKGGTLMTGARITGMFVFAAFVVLTAMVIFPKPAVRAMERVAQFLPRSFRRPVVDALEAFLSGVGVLRNPVLAFRTLLWTLLLWNVNALGFWSALKAFGFHDVPYAGALFLQSAVALGVSVPAAPGFFGTFHGAISVVLENMWGYPKLPVLALAVGFHLGGFIPVTVIGLYWARKIGLSLQEVERSEDVIETAVETETGVDPDRPADTGRARR